MRVTKKSFSRVIFFCGKLCKPITRIYRKKKLHDVMIFWLHAFTAKTKLHDLPQKKLHNVTIFLLHAFTAKKNYTSYRIKKITRCADFFLHTFTAKIKKYATLLQRKNYQFY